MRSTALNLLSTYWFLGLQIYLLLRELVLLPFPNRDILGILFARFDYLLAY